MAKLKLDPGPLPEPKVIGISSHVHPHRLCWSLNMALALELARRSDLTDAEQSPPVYFTAYQQDVGDEGERWLLVNNVGPSGVLIKEQRQADFLLVLDPEIAEGHPDLLDRLRSAEFVLTAFEVPFTSLRSGHKLLL
jgi:hypothetical protein